MAGEQDSLEPDSMVAKDSTEAICNARPALRERHPVGISEEGTFDELTIALFITVLITVLVGHGASKAVELMVYGGIILAAVAIYGRERRLRDRV